MSETQAAPAAPKRVTLKELEAKLKVQEDISSEKRAFNRAAIKAQIQELKTIERRMESGANPMLPMTELMNGPMREAQKKNPELHLRWVDESREGRPESLKALGYVKLSESEGGRQLGKSALYGLPLARYGELEAAKRTRAASQLKDYRNEMREKVEEVLDEVRSRTGKRFKNILIDDEE